MPEVRIPAEPRTEFGKGGARRTRRAGKVPAVLYGHGSAPQHLSLPAREFGYALRGGGNTLFRLDLAEGSQLALAKAVQRDPIRGDIEHVDLLVVRSGETVTVEVPIAITGEAAADTIVNHQLTALSVSAEATHLPTGFEVSVDGLGVGDSITASQIELGDNVQLVTEADAVVVGVLAAPTAEQIDAELAEATAEVTGTTEVGEGDVVPDTDSQAGGPGTSPSEGDEHGAATR